MIQMEQRSLSSMLTRVLLPRVGSVVAGIGFAFALFGADLFTSDGDVGRHVRVGRDIIESGSIPTMDRYSHTMAGQPFVPFEWLSEVLFARADSWGGLAGVAILTSALFASAVWLIYLLARLVGSGPLIASLTAALGLLLVDVHLLPRPHMFTIVFAALALLLLETYRRESATAALVWLPPLLLVWANLHGGFLVGFILLGVYLLDAWRPGSSVAADRLPLALTTAACLIASLLNPVGVGVWTHSLSYFGMDFLVDQTHEYRSPDFHQPYGKMFLVSILIGMSLLGSGRSRAGFRDLTLYLGWLSAGLMSSRNIPLFGVLAVPWFAKWARNCLTAFRSTESLGSLASRTCELDARLAEVDSLVSGRFSVSIFILALVLLAIWNGSSRYRFDPQSFPVDAVRVLDELGVSGNVFNEQPWGGYLLYVRDDIPVFIDGQTDFYGEKLSKDYLLIRQLAPGALELLDKYEINWVLLRPSVALPQALTLDAHWNLVYEDPTAVIFARASTRSEDLRP